MFCGCLILAVLKRVVWMQPAANINSKLRQPTFFRTHLKALSQSKGCHVDDCVNGMMSNAFRSLKILRYLVSVAISKTPLDASTQICCNQHTPSGIVKSSVLAVGLYFAFFPRPLLANPLQISQALSPPVRILSASTIASRAEMKFGLHG